MNAKGKACHPPSSWAPSSEDGSASDWNSLLRICWCCIFVPFRKGKWAITLPVVPSQTVKLNEDFLDSEKLKPRPCKHIGRKSIHVFRWIIPNGRCLAPDFARAECVVPSRNNPIHLLTSGLSREFWQTLPQSRSNPSWCSHRAWRSSLKYGIFWKGILFTCSFLYLNWKYNFQLMCFSLPKSWTGHIRQ